MIGRVLNLAACFGLRVNRRQSVVGLVVMLLVHLLIERNRTILVILVEAETAMHY